MRKLLLFSSLLLFSLSAFAGDWYVATNGTGGGTNWADATNSIQGAIDASTAGDTVWVSNGVYDAGGVTNWPSDTLLTNRVAITNAITVRSANNDPTNTIIKGTWDTGDPKGLGAAAVRCVYMTNGSSLIGFTLTNGATLLSGTVADQEGGGIYSQSTNTIISNCVIICNSADNYGGGANYGTLFNCLLTGNYAGWGGGMRGSTLYSCTLSGNTATDGDSPEANGGIIFNSILWPGANTNITSWNYSCAKNNGSPYTVTNDSNSITNNPLFLNSAGGNYRLSGNSPCINAGTNQDWMTNSVDLVGGQRIRQITVDMGAFESAYSISIPTNVFTNTVMSGSTTTNFTVYLVNSNETELGWQAINTSSWVTLSATNGTIPTNATVTNIITNSALALSAGAYYSRLFVQTTNYTYTSTGTVDMTLNVAEFGPITTLTATVRQGGITTNTVSIWNTGAGNLSYTMSTSTNWLTVSPISGVLTGQTAGATNNLRVIFTNTPWTVGTYTGTLTLAPTNIVGSSSNINVELTVIPKPQMLVNPLVLTGAVMMGQSPNNQTLRVSNGSSTESLGYGITVNSSWLTVSATNGTLVAPLTTNEHTVSYQTTGLTTSPTGPSNYNATITITATNSDTIGSPTNVTVNLTVNPKARLNLSTTLLTNTVGEGYDAPDGAFEIWDGNGCYTLSYTVSDNANWVMLTPASGTSTGEHAVITVEFSTANFTAGVSNALITVIGRSSDGTNWSYAFDATQTVAVSLTVTPAVELATDASATYELSARLGHPVGSTSFQVWNASAGGSILRYTIATNASWLTARPTSGTSTGAANEIILTCNANNLGPGQYAGGLTISGIDQGTGTEARNSPINIHVGLTILAVKGFDFSGDGNGASDLVIYQVSSGLWNITNLLSGYATNVMFGGNGYAPVPGDYDGNGISELGTYRYSSGYWYARPITNQYLTVFGGSYWAGPELASMGGYVSVAGDYDGDGKTDPAMYCEISGIWSALFSASGYAFVSGSFGGPGYTAVPADYDGDGETDPAVYNETTAQWYVLYSSDNYRIISGTFGGPGWTAFPADYDGDGKADGCVYNEATGLWIILPSSTLTSRGYVPVTGVFGGPGFIPVPADYNGDGQADACVYDEATGNWYIISIDGTRVAWPVKHGGYGFAPVKP